MNVTGSVKTQGRIRPFVLDVTSGELRLDVCEPVPPPKPGEPRASIARNELERRIREGVGAPVEDIVVGQYFCDRCGKWAAANTQEWSLSICMSCSLDRATELSEELDKLDDERRS
jgi:hypothetical protein